MKRILFILIGPAVVLTLVFYLAGPRLAYEIAMPAVTGLIILLCLSFKTLSRAATLLLFLGLCFCASGDVLTLFRGSPLEILGGLAFVAGLSLYVAASWRASPRFGLRESAAALIALPVSAAALFFFQPHLGENSLGTVVYLAVVTAACWRGLSLLFRRANIFFAIGLIVLYLSDLVYLTERFALPPAELFQTRLLHVLVLISYYAAQVLIAASCRAQGTVGGARRSS